jgi:hypothetical protein
MNRILFLVAAVAAAQSFAVSPVHAAYFGNAPLVRGREYWCRRCYVGM